MLPSPRLHALVNALQEATRGDGGVKAADSRLAVTSSRLVTYPYHILIILVALGARNITGNS